MPTRLLPARWFGPRFIPPRLAGASSAAVGQTATHLGVQVQPGGAVSGVPLTTQPVIAALDDANGVVTSFGGTITAAVSSGPGIVTAGANVTASAGLGAYTGLTLGLTGDPGLVTVTFSSGALTITSATFFLGATAAVVLVESPTRVRRMRRVGTAGETLAIVGEQLLGRDGTVQVLPAGSTVTLTMDPPDGGTPVIDEESCTVDSVANTVGYLGRVPDKDGVCQYQFHLTLPNGGGDLYFPDGTYATFTVIPPVA